MIKSNKIFALLGGVVICSLLFSAGCAQPVAETPQPDAGLPTPKIVQQETVRIEPEKPTPQIAEKEIVTPVPAPAEPEKPSTQAHSATLALKFNKEDLTTYRLIAESE